MAMPESDLFRTIGDALSGDGLGLGGTSGDHEAFGRSWFAKNVEKIQNVVCQSKFTREVVDGDAADDLAAILTVALIPLLKVELVALGVSAIVLRRGLIAFCRVD